MPIQILMPALSPTMEEGTLAKWHVKKGDQVESGDILAEIETDKATMEFEAADDGTITEIFVQDGTEAVKVNTPIALLVSDDDNDSELPENAIPGTSALKIEKQEDITTKKNASHPDTNETNIKSSDVLRKDTRRLFATPLARRIARGKGIDLSTVKGSGPRGRIIKADLEHSKTIAPQAASSPMQQSNSVKEVIASYLDREFEEISLTGMRKTVANRLTEAKQTVPHFYLRRSAKLDNLLAARKQLNTALEAEKIKISINDFIIKACAKALQDVPNANVVWAGDRILKLKPSDVAVAVAVEGGLFTPVLKDADTKSLKELSSEMKNLAKKARDKKLMPEEYSGGTFAISNLGMMGIENFDAVINPPHGSILAVGAGIRKPIVAEDGNISSATLMSLTLSVDHRSVDGALGATFLDRIVFYLENPIAILA